MSDNAYIERLAKHCSQLGCQVVIRQSGEKVSILIQHRDHGPIVCWSTFNGSVEETARYALISAERLATSTLEPAQPQDFADSVSDFSIS